MLSLNRYAPHTKPTHPHILVDSPIGVQLELARRLESTSKCRIAASLPGGPSGQIY